MWRWTTVKLAKFIHMLRKNCLVNFKQEQISFHSPHPLRCYRSFSFSLSLLLIYCPKYLQASLFSSNFGGKHSTPTLKNECYTFIFFLPDFFLLIFRACVCVPFRFCFGSFVAGMCVSTYYVTELCLEAVNSLSLADSAYLYVYVSVCRTDNVSFQWCCSFTFAFFGL